jgi:hypothetical protein
VLWLPLLPLPPSSNPKSGSRASLAQRRRRYLCHYLWVAGVGHDCTDNPPPPGAALPPPSSAGISLLAALPPPLPIGPPGAPSSPYVWPTPPPSLAPTGHSERQVLGSWLDLDAADLGGSDSASLASQPLQHPASPMTIMVMLHHLLLLLASCQLRAWGCPGSPVLLFLVCATSPIFGIDGLRLGRALTLAWGCPTCWLPSPFSYTGGPQRARNHSAGWGGS